MAVIQKSSEVSSADLEKLHNIRPGTFVDLQVNTNVGGKRAKTEFVGVDGNKFLILKYPDEHKWGNLRDAIYDGNTVVVRCILEENDGEIVAFKSKIAGQTSHPSKLVFVNFPTNVQRRKLRTQPRINTLIPIRLMFPEDLYSMECAEFEQSILLDLSLGGGRIAARINGKIPELKDQKVLMNLHGNKGEHFEIHGAVVNQKADDHMLYIGVHFEESKSILDELFKGLLIDVNLLKDDFADN
jgi:hypothetical protein